MDTLRLARPWASHPAGTVLGTEPGDGVAAVVDPLRLATLRERGYDAEIEAAIADPEPAPLPVRRRGAKHDR